MSILKNKRILLGVTGGVAAYKAAELLRLCQQQGAQVRVVMTQAATEFVAPLTFQALSGEPVHTGLLDAEQEAGMGHINLARWADIVLVAPASADFIARLAAGMANDLLSTLLLATDKPVMIAPAMNRVMYEDTTTQKNIRALKERAMDILGPDCGVQACGEIGFGRMLEPEVLLENIAAHFKNGALSGVHVLVNAGPTQEAIDPVRFISNHSSGKMGFAVAQACLEAGARVTLVAGPVQLETPTGAERIDVVSAQQMLEQVIAHVPEADIFIATAAVVDYVPVEQQQKKIKKQAEEIILKLAKSQDILSTVSNDPERPFCVGFAAETDDLETYAKSKLEKKSLDVIAANSVGREGVGFNSDDNALSVYWHDGAHHFETRPKAQLARDLVKLIAEKYHEKNSTENT